MREDHNIVSEVTIAICDELLNFITTSKFSIIEHY